MRRITVRGALKAYYFLLAKDGSIDEKESECFHEICSAEMPNITEQFLEELKAECMEEMMQKPGAGDNDLLQTVLAEVSCEKAEQEEQFLPARFLVWNMLVLAHANKDYAETERKLIEQTSQSLDIERDIFMEMEQMAQTAAVLSKEKERLEQSNKPYCQIRPLVVEMEHRMAVILRAAKCLIDDEVDKVESEEIKDGQDIVADIVSGAGSMFSDAGSAITDAASGVMSGVGNFFGGLFSSGENTNVDDKEEE